MTEQSKEENEVKTEKTLMGLDLKQFGAVCALRDITNNFASIIKSPNVVETFNNTDDSLLSQEVKLAWLQECHKQVLNFISISTAIAFALLEAERSLLKEDKI